MKQDTRAPALFFAPFVSSAMRVEPQWIDFNGHLNMAYYHVLFDRAVDEVFSLVGLTRDYAETRHASTFAAECHILYKRELTEGDLVRVTAQLIAFDDIHDAMHFVRGGQAELVSEEEATKFIDAARASEASDNVHSLKAGKRATR